MNRELAATALVAALFLSVISGHLASLVSANFLPPSPSSPAITVEADGSVEPSAAPIQRVGNV